MYETYWIVRGILETGQGSVRDILGTVKRQAGDKIDAFKRQVRGMIGICQSCQRHFRDMLETYLGHIRVKVQNFQESVKHTMGTCQEQVMLCCIFQGHQEDLGENVLRKAYLNLQNQPFASQNLHTLLVVRLLLSLFQTYTRNCMRLSKCLFSSASSRLLRKSSWTGNLVEMVGIWQS